jgi:hypothetical protein
VTTGAEVLDKAANTYRERNKVYVDNYIRLGNVMHGLFPEGLMINSPEEWTRLYFFLLNQVKMSRYATQWDAGGHADSTLDASVYAAMLHAFDHDIKDEQKVDR